MLLIGNNYMVWCATPATTPVFQLFGGQQNGSLGNTLSTADASHKTSGGYALKIPGLTDSPIDLTFVADLPNPGYTVVETASKAKTPVLVAVRKDGAAGTELDNIFLCSMYVTTLNVEFALNGAVSGSVKFEPEAAPTLQLTLA